MTTRGKMFSSLTHVYYWLSQKVTNTCTKTRALDMPHRPMYFTSVCQYSRSSIVVANMNWDFEQSSLYILQLPVKVLYTQADTWFPDWLLSEKSLSSLFNNLLNLLDAISLTDVCVCSVSSWYNTQSSSSRVLLAN